MMEPNDLGPIWNDPVIAVWEPRTLLLLVDGMPSQRSLPAECTVEEARCRDGYLSSLDFRSPAGRFRATPQGIYPLGSPRGFRPATA